MHVGTNGALSSPPHPHLMLLCHPISAHISLPIELAECSWQMPRGAIIQITQSLMQICLLTKEFQPPQKKWPRVNYIIHNSPFTLCTYGFNTEIKIIGCSIFSLGTDDVYFIAKPKIYSVVTSMNALAVTSTVDIHLRGNPVFFEFHRSLGEGERRVTSDFAQCFTLSGMYNGCPPRWSNTKSNFLFTVVKTRTGVPLQ